MRLVAMPTDADPHAVFGTENLLDPDCGPSERLDVCNEFRQPSELFTVKVVGWMPGFVPLLQQHSNVLSRLDVPYTSGRSTGEPIKRPRLWNAGAVLGSGNYRQKQRLREVLLQVAAQ